MSRQLIESIVSNNMLEANDMVEAKLAEIRERKMYEMKRMFAANMHEVVGGLTKAEIEARRKAGYKRASEVLGDPRDKETKRMNPSAKLVKKKVVEAVDVQPDPEGKVRGGEQKVGNMPKGTFKRKAAAVAVKGIRKTARVAGAVAGKAAVGAERAKSAYNAYKELRAASKASGKSSDADYAKAAGAEPSHPKSVSSNKRPGIVKRNINTLMGREPGHVDDRTPEEKLRAKGGRAGKAARFVAGGVAGGVGRAVRSVVSDLGDIGTSRL